MKKHLAAATILGACTVPGHAQSSVSIYGIIDAGITFIDNQAGKKQYKFADGVNYGNRLGFKGSEDLGGGNRAIFVLENGFALGTGGLRQSGRLFGRQSYVGLQSDSYGAFTMGRQYDLVKDYLTQMNVGGFASVYAGHQGDFDRISGQQLDNTVKYMSPDMKGFSFGALWKFGETAGNFHQGSAYSFGAGYKNGPLNVIGVYTHISDTTVYPYLQSGVFNFAGTTVATKNASTGVVNDLYAAGLTVDSQAIAGAGISYALGKLTLVANTSATTFKRSTGSSTMRVYEAGAIYPFSAQWLGIFGYQYAKMDNAHWNQPTVGARYNLSKRTWLYGAFSYLKSTPNVNATQGAGFYTDVSDGTHQITTRLAMIHTF
ncbi:porin [Herbaspirillum lusitanum]|jgi:outer membrane protein OmpU|uniref:Porin n=1 Tax=Herbaspirillum lusitanum TaxID=213312 RepID=A0ABW9A510_9BURK